MPLIPSDALPSAAPLKLLGGVCRRRLYALESVLASYHAVPMVYGEGLSTALTKLRVMMLDGEYDMVPGLHVATSLNAGYVNVRVVPPVNVLCESPHWVNADADTTKVYKSLCLRLQHVLDGEQPQSWVTIDKSPPSLYAAQNHRIGRIVARLAPPVPFPPPA